MKILLLGGTSFFGAEIARTLREHGHDVSLFTRGKRQQFLEHSFPLITGDRESEADLKKAASLANWDVVVDNIAYNAKHVEGALAAFPKIKRYLLTSTISVFRYAPKPHSQPLKEEWVDYEYHPQDENLDDVHWKYAHGKWAAEKTLIRQSHVPWTVFRPTIVYGPHDVTERGFWYLGRLIKGGPILLGDGGMNALKLVYSLDLASCYPAALDHTKSVGRIYNIAQREVMCPKEFLDESARILGVKRPEYVVAPLSKVGELAGPYAYDRPWVPDIQAAVRDLGFSPTPWHRFLATTAAWFRDCWKGDWQRLLSTRDKELSMARYWSEAAGKTA